MFCLCGKMEPLNLQPSPYFSPSSQSRRADPKLTSLITRHIIPGDFILLRHLSLEMPLPLLQHIELLPQIQYGFLGRISPPLGGLPAKPVAPHRWKAWGCKRRDGPLIWRSSSLGLKAFYPIYFEPRGRWLCA